ncbi:MAG: adenylosuccinate synthetase [Candidatus Korarchaeota archaeon]|nr:adenylosuccinate synthetase [Candidatus Korarchaeota archaeon]NIU83808.1 adenylosuccinate synthetase [Candidatus Thorarchaeota archaeon]NIW15222.1 adenylosuccinate synthetase [Candidatus Thorarchaeota archaeon]NIW53199.1 adenylosuccinate synthetase [Candidatus Korarchaeota archaeon]
MTVRVIVGGWYGDEGKGKIVSSLSLHKQPDIVVRGGVGPNAGHTVVYNGNEYRLRQLPSGIPYERCRLLIGPGVLVNPEVLIDELRKTEIDPSRLGIDEQVGIIEQTHIEKDRRSSHLKEEIETTGTGCGPANAERAMRVLKTAKDIQKLERYVIDVPQTLWNAIEREEEIIVEGTQGTFLSLFHGTYPYVTSKDITASAICSDVGIGPTFVDEVTLVFKAFVTRVGAGPLKNELKKEEAKKRGWHEIASVTGRERRAAPFNFDLAVRAVKLNGATELALTKLDIVYPEEKGKNKWNALGEKAKKFVTQIENRTGVPVKIISTGPDVKDTIFR